MALTGPPLVITSGSHTAAKLRQFNDSFFPTQGVANAGDLQVSQLVTPGQGVLIAPGAILMKGTSSSIQGKYGDYNDASFTLNASAADSSQTRIDRVIYQVRDPDFVGGTPPNNFVWLNGVAGSGVPPTVPVDSISLAQVARAINGNTLTNAMITDERTYASAIGGAIRGWTQAGPPTSGTYSLGQWGFDTNGILWFCITAGTPGTWTTPGGRIFSNTNVSGLPSVTISVPSWVQIVRIRWQAWCNQATGQGLQFQLNGDTSAAYSYVVQQTVSGGSWGPANFLSQGQGRVGGITQANGTGLSGSGTSLFYGCNNTASAHYFEATCTGNSNFWFGGENNWGAWYSSSAINSIKLFPTAGSFAGGIIQAFGEA